MAFSTFDGSNKIIDQTFNLLKEGETKIKFSKNKNLVLVLGNIGSGKSAFTQWIAGDNSKLISREVNEGAGEFVIEDGNRIGNSTIFGRTIFPELIEKSNAVFYDCPGFDDNKSISKDMAKAYFIKKIADYSESLKLIFVVNYSSLRKSSDQDDFLKLARHAVELIKDVSKLKESISIFSSKVDNQYIKKGEKFELVPDSVIKKSIAKFLEEIREELEKKSKISIASIMDKEFYENVIQFIDALLMKNGEDYFKIGLFRRPDKAGPLVDVELLQNEKKDAEKLVYENIKFSNKGDNDFGYTLSENTKNEINNLAKQINENISIFANDLSKKVQLFYENLVKDIKNKIESFTKNKMTKEVEIFEARDVSNKMNDGFFVLSGMAKKLDNLNSTKQFIEIIQKEFKKLGVNLSNETLVNIENQGKYLDFLKLISYKDFKISTTQFTSDLQLITANIFKSKEEIKSSSANLIEKVKTEIEAEVDEVNVKIKNSLNKKLEISPLQELLKKLNDLYEFAFSVKLNDPYLVNLKDFIQKINDGFQNLDTRIVTSTVNIMKLEKSWEFLKILSNNEADTNSINSELFIKLWTSIFNTIKHYKDWVSFIDLVYERLSEYDVQKDTVKCIKNLDIENKNVDSNNFNQFLQKINEKYGLKSDLDRFKPSDFELQLLNTVLDIFLKTKVDFSCKQNKLVVKGDYVKFSDLKKYMNSCKNNDTQIFALNKLFIDENLNQTGTRTKLMTISPQTELIGDRIIALDGLDAKSNSSLKDDDSDGIPGEPGSSGGSFLAISKKTINDGSLKITANGGRGGDGTNGSEGNVGLSPDQGGDIEHYKENYWWSRSSCDNVCPSYRSVVDRFGNEFDCNLVPSSRGWSYIFHGKIGDDGKNGGHGGIGGQKGSIQLIGFESNSNIKILNIDGKNGTNGKAGCSGLDGGDLYIYCITADGWYYRPLENHFFRSGKNGTDGANENGLKKPEEASKINNQTVTTLLGDYKNYLRENLSNRFRSDKLKQFYEFLETNSQIENHYTTLSIVDDLKALEEQYFTLNKLDKNNLIFLYKSFLQRVKSYAKNLKKEDKDLIENKKVLSYLYTKAAGKLYNLKNDPESTLTIDISGYLDIVNKDMIKLKNLKDEENKFNIIKKYKKEYKENIDKKIEEANELINKNLLPELDKIGKEMDNKLDTLVKEVLELEKKAQEDHDSLVKKKHELERQMSIHVGFGVLKFIGAGLAFLGPWGSLAGSVIDSAVGIGEDLALGDESGLPPLNLNDEDVKNLKNNLERLKNRKIDELKKLIEILLQDLEEYKKEHNDSNELKDVEEKILAVQQKIKDAAGNELNSLFKEVEKILSDKENELKNKKISAAKEKESALKKIGDMIGKFKTIANLGVEIYNKYKNDKNKLAAINNAIKQNESIISGLKEYENQVYETIIPMLHEMEGDLKKVSEALKNKSQVALDVTKWKTQMILRDMKLEMHQLTQGFKVQANIERCIEKQEETMNTLTNIYDRIETYQDQQALGNYLANICSPAAKKIGISNPDLANSVRELEIAIRSNIVLKQYADGINGLKQWVFPLAQVYLKELKLPDQFKLDKSLDNQIDEVAEQLENIKRKIAIYKTSVQKSDEYVHNGEFSSNYQSTDPFYVFKNKEHPEMIKKVLAGEEVTVNADILDSVAGKDAIKFNRLEINFKPKNESLQSEIKNKLNQFKISATHLGNSYYRCDKKIYSITTPSQTIEYSLEKKEDGSPVDQNDVYRKISEGDLMLSPYAMWRIQLIKAKASANFSDLEKYKNEIDLELVGYGGYIADKINVSSLEVDKYYRHDDTVIMEKEDEIQNNSFFDNFKRISLNFFEKLFTRNNHLNKEEIDSYPDQNLIGYRPTAYDFETPNALIDNHSNQNTVLRSVYSPVDTFGNLMLGQLIVGKRYGPNKYLNSNNYVSPDFKRKIQINELSKRILPILNKKDDDF